MEYSAKRRPSDRGTVPNENGNSSGQSLFPPASARHGATSAAGLLGDDVCTTALDLPVGDDLLAIVLRHLRSRVDRNNASLVSRRWRRVLRQGCLQATVLRAEVLRQLATTCPHLQTLDLKNCVEVRGRWMAGEGEMLTWDCQVGGGGGREPVLRRAGGGRDRIGLQGWKGVTSMTWHSLEGDVLITRRMHALHAVVCRAHSVPE